LPEKSLVVPLAADEELAALLALLLLLALLVLLALLAALLLALLVLPAPQLARTMVSMRTARRSAMNFFMFSSP